MRTKVISQADAPTSVPPRCAPNPRQRILVVDDDAVIRCINTDVLTHSGYDVDAAEDGAAAWDALQLSKYDLVVTDNDMPKVTGVELIQKLQAARSALPVIMATAAMPAEEFARHRLQLPAMTLLKPYAVIELVVAVKNVLRAASDSFGKSAPPHNWQVQPLADRVQWCRFNMNMQF